MLAPGRHLVQLRNNFKRTPPSPHNHHQFTPPIRRQAITDMSLNDIQANLSQLPEADQKQLAQFVAQESQKAQIQDSTRASLAIFPPF